MRSIRFGVVAALTAATMLTSGCATVLSSSHSRVMIHNPSPAKAYVDGQYVGVTPVEVNLDNAHDHSVVLEKNGQRSRAMAVTSSIGIGWIILDVVCGFWPIVIDAVTGKWKSLDQSTVSLQNNEIARRH